MVKCYIIANLNMTNPDALVAGYASKIQCVIEQFGGKFLVRDSDVPCAEEDKAELGVIVEFPGVAAAQACMASDAYKEIKSARTENTSGQFMVVEGV